MHGATQSMHAQEAASASSCTLCKPGTTATKAALEMPDTLDNIPSGKASCLADLPVLPLPAEPEMAWLVLSPLASPSLCRPSWSS